MKDEDNTSDIVMRDDVVDDSTLEAHHTSASKLHSLKKAGDGHTILVPQPNDDPKNPLNWPMRKKIAVLLAVSFAAILPDYGSATGAVTLIPQGLDWGLSPNYVNHSQAGNVFMLGAGGVFAVILSQAYGRYPVALWMVAMSLIWAILCAAAPHFQAFMAARILNGFFSGPTQATGLMFVRDMFFFHELARATNLWVAFFILSPYLGPLVAAGVLSTNETNVKLWRWAFGEFTILTGLALIGLILFADETFYNRRVAERHQPERGNKIARMTGVGRPANRTRWTLGQSFIRTFATLFKPTIFLTCIAYISTFAWVVGINTTLSLFLEPPPPQGYGFGAGSIALFYLTPILASVIGEIQGHFANDAIANWYIRRHHGRFEPEVRLVAYLTALPTLIAGLNLLGFALERHYSFWWAAFGWFLFVHGIMVASTGLTTYALDTFPHAAGEVSCWLNLSRVLGGFIISYFQINWAESRGTIQSFGIQSGVVAFGGCVVVFLMVFGRRIRHWQGHPPYPHPTQCADLEDEAAIAASQGTTTSVGRGGSGSGSGGGRADSIRSDEKDTKGEVQHVA